MPRDASLERVKTVKLSPFIVWETFRVKVLGRKFVQNVGDLTIANVMRCGSKFYAGYIGCSLVGT